jgi:hypothetical protein
MTEENKDIKTTEEVNQRPTSQKEKNDASFHPPSEAVIKRKTFKENWESVDETCPSCHQVTKRATGITRQNIKRLFIGKPTINDWIFFFIVAATLFMAYEYNVETSQCHYIENNLNEVCMKQGYFSPYGNQLNNTNPLSFNTQILNLNISNITNAG